MKRCSHDIPTGAKLCQNALMCCGIYVIRLSGFAIRGYKAVDIEAGGVI